MRSTWVFPKIGLPQNGWFTMVPTLLKWDDLGGFPPILWKHPHIQKKNSEVPFPPITSRWLCQSLPQNLQQLCGFIGRQLGQAIHLNTAFRIHTDLAPETKNLPGSHGPPKKPSKTPKNPAVMKPKSICLAWSNYVQQLR